MNDSQGQGRRRITAVVGLVAALACSESAEEDPANARVEIFSWWVSGGEVEALNALLEVHQERHPDAAVVNLVTAANAQVARDELTNRMASGVPPDTFQANAGWGLLSWAPDAVEPLDGLAKQNGWTDTFEPAVLEAASRDGKLYGVPLNIHRINSFFYNRAVLEEHDIAPPTTLEELNQACATLRAAGLTPIALGNENAWVLQQFVFEHILPAIGGGEFYERYWTGQEQADAPQISQTLDYIIQLSQNGCFNTDSESIDWPEALDRVGQGSAAFSAMGDWAKGYLESQGYVANEDFGVVPTPGSVGLFVFTSDSFPLPRGAKNRAGALNLLATMGSVDGQREFNLIKGSIPARIDVDPSTFDSMQQQTYAAWKNDEKRLALSGLLRPDALLDLQLKLRDTVATGDPSQVITYLVNNYSTLD